MGSAPFISHSYNWYRFKKNINVQNNSCVECGNQLYCAKAPSIVSQNTVNDYDYLVSIHHFYRHRHKIHPVPTCPHSKTAVTRSLGSNPCIKGVSECCVVNLVIKLSYVLVLAFHKNFIFGN